MLDVRKPHISMLPVIEFPEYNFNDKAKIGIYIPIFSGKIDTNYSISGMNIERFKNIHAKGAVWSAISWINNTDIADYGTPIYLYVEKCFLEHAQEIFNMFKVPEKHIKTFTIDSPVTDIQNPHFGKKLHCLSENNNFDNIIISDSDAFICTSGKKLEWHDKIASLNNPSVLSIWNSDYSDNFGVWLKGINYACGKLHSEEDSYENEVELFNKLGFSSPENPKTDGVRNNTATQIITIPKKNSINEFLLEHYKTCYQDEFLFGMWNMNNNFLVDLSKYLDIKPYFWETEYKNRNYDLDKNGYVYHVLPDIPSNTARYSELCFPSFVDHLNFDYFYPILSYIDIKSELNESTSDKTHVHNYGDVYNSVFNEVYHKLKRPLRVLEIGVSRFGSGSLLAFEKLDEIESVVGIDIEEYQINHSGKISIYKMDAYHEYAVNQLCQNHLPFDIIIDDGSHIPEHQQFILEKYFDRVLSFGGSLIIEDVNDDDLIAAAIKEGSYSVRSENNFSDSQILIKKKTDHKIKKIEINKSKKDNITLHLPGIAYGPTRKDFNLCPFIQKTWHIADMMQSKNYNIIHYGHNRSDINCAEHVDTINDGILWFYGAEDGIVPEYNVNDYAFTYFTNKTIYEMKKRYRQNDIILLSFPHEGIYNAFPEAISVEYGIGYSYSYAKNRIFESNVWRHFIRGKEEVSGIRSYLRPDWNSYVIPNYFDPDEYICLSEEQRDDTLLYLGRIIPTKGIELAIEASIRAEKRLIVAGNGDWSQFEEQASKGDVLYVGPVDIEQRKDLLSRCKALIVPSFYIEPFQGTVVQGMLSGCIPIVLDQGAPTETIINKKTGYICNDGKDILDAISNIWSRKINLKKCRQYALKNFSKESISNSYDRYFKRLENESGLFWE